MRSVLSIIVALALLIAPVPMAVAGGIVAGVGDGPSGPVTALPAGDVSPQGLVNFDALVAPCLFANAVALKSLNGVAFKVVGDIRNGGAVLNECADFPVSGFSPPNYLAFNCSSMMSDGGVPRLPETIVLPFESSNVSLKVGASPDPPPTAKSLKLIGKGSQGKEVHVVKMAVALQTVAFTVPVRKIKLKSAKASDPVCQLVVDDLSF